MNGSEIKQFKTAIDIYFRDPDRIKKTYKDGKLQLCSAGMFVLDHILNDTIHEINPAIHNLSVVCALEIFRNEKYFRTAITGDFYNELRERYLRILNVHAENDPSDPTSNVHLAWMLVELGSDNMSETKKHRWLGYIQGCMTCDELIEVQEERDLTRSIFNGK